jgi:hypothetical protein
MFNSNYTSVVFEVLSKGQFISSNTADGDIQRLYNVIENNFDEFYDYFVQIKFVLERGDEYFYFSKKEIKTDLERKLEKALQWIDILDFLKTYDYSFGSGYRGFTASDIFVRTNIDAELKSKLESLGRITKKEKPLEIIEQLLKDLQSDRFIEVENEISNSYKVLAAFDYLEKLVSAINIIEEENYEIPQ